MILVASVVYGLGLLSGGIPRHWHWLYLGLVFLVAIAAGAVMTLAWGLLYSLMGDEDEGALAGLATMTKGIGIVIGPLATGGAIDLLKGVFASTDGYAAMWPVLALPILAAIPLLFPLRRAERRATHEASSGQGARRR